MRFVIVGAGAVGGTLGARLIEAGREVVMVARGEQLARSTRGGLRVEVARRLVHRAGGGRRRRVPFTWRAGDVVGSR